VVDAEDAALAGVAASGEVGDVEEGGWGSSPCAGRNCGRWCLFRFLWALLLVMSSEGARGRGDGTLRVSNDEVHQAVVRVAHGLVCLVRNCGYCEMCQLWGTLSKEMSAYKASQASRTSATRARYPPSASHSYSPTSCSTERPRPLFSSEYPRCRHSWGRCSGRRARRHTLISACTSTSTR
jgi:hypothetical protein